MSAEPFDQHAESVFARFLAEREENESVGFESWCARQPEVQAAPDLAARLARLFSAWDALARELEAPRGRDVLASFFRPRAQERGGKRPAPTESALRAGQQIGPFVLQTFIAQGGMGQLWVALDQELRRQVALKLVLPGRVDLRNVELFAREARAGGRLAHPNIVTTLAHGSDGGLAWIAQELVEGSWTLKDFLDELRAADAVPKDYYPKVADLAAQLADALAAAHEAGVIHRDVKPQNVLIAPDDRPKLTDFGLARVVDDSVLSRSGDFAGTYAYMSPEQVTGKRMGLDHRTDVFSLGIVLYELLTLRRPFEGDTTHQIAARIITFDPPDAARIRSQCPRDLAVICAKALEKDPDRRYQTMREFAADLRRHLSNEPILARPSGAWTHAVKWVKRHPVVSSSGAVAGLAFVIVAGLLVENVRTNDKLGQANTALERSNTDLSDQTRLAQDNATLAERRAGETAEQARIAEANEELAKSNEAAATRESERADEKAREANDVLSLSAVQDLQDLLDRADALWPAHPENLAGYESWLADARELIEGRPDDDARGIKSKPSLEQHKAKLLEIEALALPQTVEERTAERAAHPRAKELAEAGARLQWMQRMLGEDAWPSESEIEAQLAVEKLPTDADGLNKVAWPLVDTDKPVYGSEVRGLLLAHRAVAAAPQAQRHMLRDTLAWALFRTSRFEDALSEARRALAEAPETSGSEYAGYVKKLEEAVSGWRGDDGSLLAARRAEAARIASEVAALEVEVNRRKTWSFADGEARWWHVQLSKLVADLESLRDAKTGLFSSGISEARGWGIVRRAEFARFIEERTVSGEDAKRRWSEAIAAIASSPKYGGLQLTPQLGLLPISADPDSGLWEFAHLQTGDVAERGADGKLVLTDGMGLVFVLIPGRTFAMGAQSDPAEANFDPQAAANESPVHEVTLDAYFLSKYELTQGQWERFVGRNPSQYRPGVKFGQQSVTLLNPVEQVSWTDCTQVLGRIGLELPTEAQWERAARADTSSVWWTGDEKETLAGAANLADAYCKSNGGPSSWSYEEWLNDGTVAHTRIGSYRANAYGLHDVVGNVWEWCRDGYGGYDQPVRAGDGERQVTGSASRVLRGGSFTDAASSARSAYRNSYTPESRSNSLGLRPARASRLSPSPLHPSGK